MSDDGLDPYAPPTSDLSGPTPEPAPGEWATTSSFSLSRALEGLRKYTVLVEDVAVFHLLPERRLGNDFVVVGPGDPGAETGLRLRYSVGLASRRVTVSDPQGELGCWRRRFLGDWRLITARDASWVGTRIQRSFFKGVRLLDSLGAPLANLEHRALWQRADVTFAETLRLVPRDLVLGLALGYLLTGS